MIQFGPAQECSILYLGLLSHCQPTSTKRVVSAAAAAAAAASPPCRNSSVAHFADRNGMWEILHVPAKPPFPPHNQPTVNVLASAIEPKAANSIVRRLNQIEPLESFRHVKRIKKERLEGGKFQLYVILCTALDGEEDPLKCMPDAVLELVSSYQLSAFVAKVCEFPALSKEEWEEQCKLWPTSYHPPTYNIDGITGFDEEDAQYVSSFMEMAIHLAKSQTAQVCNAAIIVDPLVRQVIASATDEVFYSHKQTEMLNLHDCYQETNSHNHIDLNRAETPTNPNSNGTPNEVKYLYDGVSCLHPWKWITQQLSCSDSCNWHPLRHAALSAVDYSAARDRQLYPCLTLNTNGFIEMQQVQLSLEDSPLKRQKTAKEDTEDARNEADRANTLKFDRPYLCTGYDIFLVWEPCVMCAMSLVHQRIRRIFFAFPNPHAGALGSVHRLQGEESLNHHYAVFRVLAPEERLAIFESVYNQ